MQSASLTFVRCAAATGGFAACLGCATAEDLSGEPVRPGQEMGAAGATGSGATGGSSPAPGGAASVGNGASGASASSGGASGNGSGGVVADSGASGGAGEPSSGGVTASGGAPALFDGAAGGTSAPSGELLFFDDFEGADAALSGWISVPADGWSITLDESNVYQQGTLDTLFRVSSAGDSAWTDQAIEARVKVLAFTGSSTSYLAGIYARFADLNNHYYVALQSNGEVKIKKKAGGSNTSISSSAETRVAVGTWYTVKLEVRGSTLTAYLDGAPVLTAQDADIAAGGIAIGTKNATAQFDDVRVTVP